MFRNLINWLKGPSGTESHYREQAGRAAGSFSDEPPPPPPFAEPVEEDIPWASPAEVQEPNIELVDFAGSSTDIKWMTFNHDTGEVVIQFLEHGDESEYAYLYVFKDIPHEEFMELAAGSGPFPRDRHPYYQKEISVGQRMNFYIRHDHLDDLYQYERIERENTR